jgi:transcriptional regulator with XRE-family HTH domain
VTDFGAVLRTLRRQAGLSLAKLAAKTDQRWKEVVVGSYERGDRNPTVATYDELLRVFGHRLEVLGPGDLVLRDHTTDPAATVVWVVTAEGVAIDCEDYAEAERIHRLIAFSRIGYRHVSAVMYPPDTEV